MRRTAMLLVCCALAAGCGAGNQSTTVEAENGTAATLTPVTPDQIVVVTADRVVKVIAEDGATVRVLDDGNTLRAQRGVVNSVDVSPVGNRALVSFLNDSDGACTSTVYEATDQGLRRLLDGAAATFDPTGTRIAYVRYELRDEFCLRSELVIRDLADGQEVASPIPGGEALDGNPVESLLSWSPDGSRLALNSGGDQSPGMHVVTVEPDGGLGEDEHVGRFFTAAFAEDSVLFGSPDCCIQNRFAARNLDDGTTTDLGPVPTVLTTARRDRGGTGFWLTLEEEGLRYWDGKTLHTLPRADNNGKDIVRTSG